jgi:outer membrane biosynthesis protein TonB
MVKNRLVGALLGALLVKVAVVGAWYLYEHSKDCDFDSEDIKPNEETTTTEKPDNTVGEPVSKDTDTKVETPQKPVAKKKVVATKKTTATSKPRAKKAVVKGSVETTVAAENAEPVVKKARAKKVVVKTEEV